MSADRPAYDTHEAPFNSATDSHRRPKRRLRTYSRRSAQARAQELVPVAKEEIRPDANLESGRVKLPPESTGLPKEGSRQPVNRGTILAYFKPSTSTPSSDSPSSDALTSDLAEPASTPPSSPPPLPKPRKRRRLTTRPRLSEEGHHSSDGAGDGLALGDPLEGTKALVIGDSPAGQPSFNATTEIQDENLSALGDISVNVLDCGTRSASVTSEHGAGGKKPSEKRSAREMTQTILSLSVHKDSAFTICAVCDILYNPLNEKDRKEHKRRHAAYSRTKGKTSSTKTR